MNTKPKQRPDAIPGKSGWIDPVTGECLVAIGNLDKLLEAEQASTKVEVAKPSELAKLALEEVAVLANYKPVRSAKKKLDEVKTEEVASGQVLLGEVVTQEVPAGSDKIVE